MPAEPGTTASGWVVRVIVSAHAVAIAGQPVFAGVYLSGDYDALGWHAAGADAVTVLGYAQLVAAVVAWVRLRRAWPLWATLALVVAETAQYFAGLDGTLWLHIPLGVLTVVGAVLLFAAAWLRPLGRATARRERARA